MERYADQLNHLLCCLASIIKTLTCSLLGAPLHASRQLQMLLQQRSQQS